MFLWGTPTTETPTLSQIKLKVRESVCKNFCSIRYSGTKDSPETVMAARKHNSTLSAYKCSEIKLARFC
jgi:hypothetical protein